MDKYQNTLVIDKSKQIPYYKSVLLSSIPTENTPFYYVTRVGDRLDTISNTFYKTPRNWWILAKANNFANGNVSIPEGTKLLIPNV